jgi:hypothetical protein
MKTVNKTMGSINILECANLYEESTQVWDHLTNDEEFQGIEKTF